MILIKINRSMRIKINYDKLNHLLSTIFAVGIAKTHSIHDFLVKNKYLMFFKLK